MAALSDCVDRDWSMNLADLRQRVVLVIARTYDGTLPTRASAELTREQGERVVEAAQRHAHRVAEADAVVAQVVDELRDAVRGRGLTGPKVQRKALLERTSAHLREPLVSPTPPTTRDWAAWAHTTATEVLAGLDEVHAVREPSSAELVQVASGYYDDRWSAVGEATYAIWPPSDVDVGSDRRPPLLEPPGPDGARSTATGNDRSVELRVRGYFDGRRIRACRQGPRRFAGPDPTGQVVREAVDRACSRYGLARVENQHAVVAISRAGLFAWARLDDQDMHPARAGTRVHAWLAEAPEAVPTPPPGFSDASQPQTRAEADADLVDVMSALVAGRWNRHPVAAIVRSYQVNSELVSRALVRKVWMGLETDEICGNEPTRRQLVHHTQVAADTVPKDVARRPDAAPVNRADDRVAHTALWLTTLPTEVVAAWVTAIRSGDRSWRAPYEARAAAESRRPMTADELQAWVLSQNDDPGISEPGDGPDADGPPNGEGR